MKGRVVQKVKVRKHARRPGAKGTNLYEKAGQTGILQKKRAKIGGNLDAHA